MVEKSNLPKLHKLHKIY